MIRLKTIRNLKFFSRWLSDEGLTRKAYLNALAATVEYGSRLIVGFIINPILVAGLGGYLYGIWQILLRVFSYISAASGRPTFALTWSLANQQASADYERKRQSIGSTIIVWLLFLPVLIIIGGLLTWFIPSLLKIPMEYSWSIRLVGGLLVANLIMKTLSSVPQAVLQGENMGYKRMGLSAVLVLVGGGLTALALYLDTGLIGIATANLTITFLTGIFFLQVVRAYVPWFGIARPSFEAVRQFLGLSGWFIVWDVINQLMIASDIIVLGVFASVELVTTYSLTKYVPESLMSFVGTLVFGITPGLGGIIGAGDLQKAVRLRSEIMSLTWLIASIVGTTTLLWNQSFIQLWVGAKYYAGSTSTLLIILMVTQFALIRNDASIIDLTLNLRRKVLMGGLSFAVSLVFSGILVGVFNLGITGVCVGFIIGHSILSLGYPWLIGRFLGDSLLSQLKRVPRAAFTSVLLFGLGFSVNGFLTVNTWIGLVLSVGMTLVVVSLLAFYISLSSDQRKHIWRRIRLVTESVKFG